VLVESRRYRIAALAICRSSGDIRRIAQATLTSRAQVRELLEGHFAFLTAGRAGKLATVLPEHVRAWVQESKSWPISVGEVPCPIVAPLLEEAFGRYGRERTARIVGLEPRYLYAITQERRGVLFATADRIAVTLASPSWWNEEPERLRWLWGHSAIFGQPQATRRDRRLRERVLVAA